jgi:hypothetical protein
MMIGLGFHGKGAFPKSAADDPAFDRVLPDIDFFAHGIGIVPDTPVTNDRIIETVWAKMVE